MSSPSPNSTKSALWFLESLDRVNRTIARAHALPAMLDELMQTALEVFGSDRAWLLTPCDPDAPSWRTLVERTAPEYLGATALGVDLPMTDELAAILRAGRDADGPVVLHSAVPPAAPDGIFERFGVKSGVGVGVRPAAGPSYLFGLHQCSHRREWSAEELRLMEEIARRITDALNNLVAFEVLRASERRLLEAQRLAQVGDWEADFRTGVVTLSEEAARIFGVEGRTSVSFQEWEAHYTHAIHPDDRELALTTRRRAMEVPGRHALEYRLPLANGGCRWLRSTAESTIGEHGRVVRLVGTIHDITPIRRVEEERDASERRFRQLVDHAADAIFLHGEDGTIRDVNQRACDSLGYTREELVGVNVAAFDPRFSPADHDHVHRRLGVGETFSFESLHRRKDGRTFPVEVRIRPFTIEDGGVLALSIVTDISERKRHEEELHRLEAELRQAQKMEAIGRLAGGIAHDFNNLLTVINGCGELALESIPEGPARELLGEVIKAGERAAQLTSQLLSFSRKQVLVAQIYDLDAVIGDLLKMLRRVIGEDIELVLSPPSGESLANVDRGQLEQSLINLVVNARQAMPRGGTITIGVRNVEQEGGSWVEVVVSDTGTGMDPETLSHIFEPFFTTKGPGGTGLGLSMVYGFVTQSGGRVEVDSQLGRGSTFHLRLPRVSGKLVPSEKPAHSDAVRGSGKVLLVEDADAVRGFATQVLSRAGFEVVEARSGGEALALEAHHPDIHLVITDMVMPQMSGQELVVTLRSRRPSLPVLFISGYSDEPLPELQAAEHGGASAPTRFLRKPFGTGALAAKVRELLDAERSASTSSHHA